MKMALGLNDSRRMWATGKVVAFNVLHGCEPVRMDGIVPAHKRTGTGKYTYRPAHTSLCVHAYNIFNFSHFLTNEKSNER